MYYLHLKPLKAQDIWTGPTVGINFTSLTGQFANGNAKKSSLFGINAGLAVSIEWDKKFFIKPELHYSKQGSRLTKETNGSKIESELKISYLSLPVLIGFSSNEKDRRKYGRYYINAGPYLGYLVSDEAKFHEKIQEFEGNNAKIQKFDAGITIGAGLGIIAAGEIIIDARYSLGLIPIIDGRNNKNSTISISIAYFLPIYFNMLAFR